MKQKLTVLIPREVATAAKEYARETGQDLSTLVENYLKAITQPDSKVDPKSLSPRVQRLRGILGKKESLS